MKCQKHEKQSIGTCQWCGKLLCRECVGKSMGKKLFCRECSGGIGDIIQQRQLDMLKEQNEKEKKQRKFMSIWQK